MTERQLLDALIADAVELRRLWFADCRARTDEDQIAVGDQIDVLKDRLSQLDETLMHNWGDGQPGPDVLRPTVCPYCEGLASVPHSGGTDRYGPSV